MREVPDMPTEGQFVAVWTFGGTIRSAAYCRGKRFMKEYDAGRDRWVRTDGPLRLRPNVTNTRFFVAE